MTLLQPELRAAIFDSIQGERVDGTSITTSEILGGVVRVATRPHRKKLFSVPRSSDELLEYRIVDWWPADARERSRTMEDKRRCRELLDARVPNAVHTAAAVRLDAVTRQTGKFRYEEVKAVNPQTAGPL